MTVHAAVRSAGRIGHLLEHGLQSSGGVELSLGRAVGELTGSSAT
jgi:hypothetical protein